jgi:hypothetical protein
MRNLSVFFIAVTMVLSSAVSQAATNTASAGLTDSGNPDRGDKIILPDVDLRIDDESEVPLKDQTNSSLKDNAADYGKIDMEELSRTKVSDKFKNDMQDERRKEDFSLSSFKFYYGLFQNFIADINIGKSSGGLNYLLTYLRNNRGSSAYGTNVYFNTEQEIDDLNLDMIWTLGSNLDLSGMVGYYVRNNGLFTNLQNVSETKMNIPVRLGMLYNTSYNSSLKLTADYDNLLLSHKLTGGYSQKYLWDAGLSADFEANWSKDNFLKMSAQYQYGSYDSDIVHFGKMKFLDKFPILSVVSLQVGAEVDLYNFKGIFWYPNVMAFYKYSDVITLKAGVYGEQANLSVDRYVNENQIDYRLSSPEEKWIALFSAVYAPVRWMKFRGGVSYNHYLSYVNYAYVPATDLYVFSPMTNVGVVEASAGFEMIAFENLTLNASYQLRLPFSANLLFFNYNSASFEAVFRYPDWGFEVSTKFTYRDRVQYNDQALAYFEPALVWDFAASQALGKDVFIEVKLNDLLNQPVFDRPDMPAGGFHFIAGVRILL